MVTSKTCTPQICDILASRPVCYTPCFVNDVVCAGINLFLGLMPYLDNFSHIGGLVMGFTLALWLCVLPRVNGHGESVPKRCYTQLLRVSGCVVSQLVPGAHTAVHDRSRFVQRK
jgi:hypothetical protein